jgi:hypothetical protein
MLTIPATVASAERLFSKLKLVKNYWHSTMSQDRLVNLARLTPDQIFLEKGSAMTRATFVIFFTEVSSFY